MSFVKYKGVICNPIGVGLDLLIYLFIIFFLDLFLDLICGLFHRFLSCSKLETQTQNKGDVTRDDFERQHCCAKNRYV